MPERPDQRHVRLTEPTAWLDVDGHLSLVAAFALIDPRQVHHGVCTSSARPRRRRPRGPLVDRRQRPRLEPLSRLRMPLAAWRSPCLRPPSGCDRTSIRLRRSPVRASPRRSSQWAGCDDESTAIPTTFRAPTTRSRMTSPPEPLCDRGLCSRSRNRPPPPTRPQSGLA